MSVFETFRHSQTRHIKNGKLSNSKLLLAIIVDLTQKSDTKIAIAKNYLK